MPRNGQAVSIVRLVAWREDRQSRGAAPVGSLLRRPEVFGPERAALSCFLRSALSDLVRFSSCSDFSAEEAAMALQ